MFYLVTVLLLSAFSAFSFAEDKVYRWTDTQGSTHFSNELPDGVRGEEVGLSSKPIRVKKGEAVYIWKDSEGKVYYGDQPPADRSAEKLDMKSQPMSTIRGTAVRPGERDLLRE